ncbi:MAG: rod shape-determining protein MreC [Tannerellaceae bacterium]|jgi:rod shape-determining protein MreC|nr:rod shape-determining protein MreC [Tannerellaceae bacterium]
MRKLLDFLINRRNWFLFLFLELISFTLIYRNNAYQQSIMLSTANVVAANVVSAGGSVTSYLSLRDKNKELIERNGQLEIEILRLQRRIETMATDTMRFQAYAGDSAIRFPFATEVAKVVNNSVSYLANYITIDKGSADGIEPDMGVVSERGVAGIVSTTVSEHYAVVIPVLNPKFRLSCKVLGSGYFGSMSWDGRDVQYAKLDELPRHVEFQVGDTIVTSAFSAIFPEGIMMGTVSSFEKQRDDNYYSLTVKLATDFTRLNTVMVIKNYHKNELKRIELEARGND